MGNHRPYRDWHKDHLGSVVATTDHNGLATARYSYDPFGKRRTASGNYDANGALVIDWNTTSSGTDRGYTGHEHLDDVGVIHMNGRLFDPRLGRFMQGDPFIQDPGNLQNYNRYAYCYNNPAACTDPTGQWNWSNVLNTNVGANLFFLDAGSFMLSRVTARNKTGYQLGSIAIGVLSAFWCEGAAYLCNAAGQAVWSGFAGRTFEESLKTGVIAGATTYAMGAVGDTWSVDPTMANYSPFMNMVGHAAVGCGSSAASGGSCKSGAMAGGFSAAWSNYGPSYEAVNGNSGILIKNTMIAATVGGAGSVIGGGKFWNGARTGAFGYLFNFAAHEGKDYLLNGKENSLRKLWERVFGPDRLSSEPEMQAGMSVGVTVVHGLGFAGDIGPYTGNNGTCQILANQCFVIGPMIAYTADFTLLNASAGSPGPGWSLNILGKFSVPIGGVQASAGYGSDGIVGQLGRSYGPAFGVAAKYCVASAIKETCGP